MKIKGNKKDNELIGTAEDDTILGKGGNDTIIAKGGHDTVFGGEGNDVIRVATNTRATIDAGAGRDTVVLTARARSSDISLGKGADVVDIAAAKKSGQQFVIDGGKGTDRVNFALGQDQYEVTGGDGAYTVVDANGNTYTLTSIESLTFNGIPFVPEASPVNNAPVLATPIADQTATLNAAYAFQIAPDTFTDPDGDTLTYTATLADGSPLPSWLTFDPATLTFSGTPTSAGAVTVRVTASDGSLTASDDFVIGVTGGGGNNAPVFVNSYGDLDALHLHDGSQLYTGKGNPAKGFALSVNEQAGIELGLDVRYRGDGKEIAPTDKATYTWVVDALDLGNLRFAYSAAADLGLDKYDFRLSIDTDRSEGEYFRTLTLGADKGNNPYTNNGNSRFDWFDGQTPVIQDDGGDADGRVTQNIQALYWYLQNEMKDWEAGDEFKVKLEAFIKGTGTKLAGTEITIVIDQPDFVNSYGDLTHVFAGNQLYAGKGNPANGFALAVNDEVGIELGLDVRYKGNGNEIAPDEEDGTTWTVSADNLDNLRFAYSAAADHGLDKFDFRLSIDIDGSDEEQFIEFHLGTDSVVSQFTNNEHSIFDWYNSNGKPVIKDDGGNAGGHVTQNVQALHWYVPGGLGNIHAGDEYTIKLEAFAKDTNILLAGTEITIQIAEDLYG